MISVQVCKEGRFGNDYWEKGVATSVSDGWLYIHDEEGLTIGGYPESVVVGFKAGENKVTSDNPKDGN